MLTACSARSTLASFSSKIRTTSRGYAISLQSPKIFPGKKLPRVFRDKKGFQYHWYMRLLTANQPVLLFHHEDFSAQRLMKLRLDILAAARQVKPSLASPLPTQPAPEPSFTVVRTSIFGAALRDLTDVNTKEAEKMIGGQTGCFAVLTLPSLDPPLLTAVLRAIDRSVPPRPPKTKAEIEAELAAKTADVAQPGRREKRMRRILVPLLELKGALIEGKVFLPQGVKDVSKLPSLHTLRQQIVGLLSAPSAQLLAVLNEAQGGKLARTLDGLRRGLEGPADESASEKDTPTPP